MREEEYKTKKFVLSFISHHFVACELATCRFDHRSQFIQLISYLVTYFYVMDFNAMLSNLKRDAAAASASESTLKKRLKINEEEVSISGSSTTTTKKQIRPFPTKQVNKIYLVCPPNVQTGGPEAMHQLCDKINAKETNVSSFMLYVEDRGGRAHFVKHAKSLAAYSIYPNLKVCASLEDADTESCLIIWPECWTNLIDALQTGEHQKAIWWLSVNNNNGKFQEWCRRDILHLYQSEYAKCHIIKNLEKTASQINDVEAFITKQVLPMTEYIPQRHGCQFKGLPLEHEILYNPLKGIHYTDEIRRRGESKFLFTPIGGKKRLSPLEVTKLLSQAKVYIDFGPHPGMDRLPREAAIANCIVITNKEGAAFHDEDVPIPADYKIGTFDVERIHKLLKDSVENYKEKTKEFDSYRNWISSQETKMETCVERLITSVVTERSP